MGKVVVKAFTVSIGGFGAGPGQDLKNPLGVRGEELHRWMHKARMFHRMLGQAGGTTDVDNEFAEKSMEGVGAWIMGRNMFGPIRGKWPDESWRGWWEEDPPYHVPVYVLTHHARAPVEMKGGTTFRFVTDGLDAALGLARETAGGKDIRIGGGVSTVRQYLKAGLVDELHLAVSPVLLGKGENLYAELNWSELGYACSGHVAGADALHVTITRGKG